MNIENEENVEAEENVEERAIRLAREVLGIEMKVFRF